MMLDLGFRVYGSGRPLNSGDSEDVLGRLRLRLISGWFMVWGFGRTVRPFFL